VRACVRACVCACVSLSFLVTLTKFIQIIVKIGHMAFPCIVNNQIISVERTAIKWLYLMIFNMKQSLMNVNKTYSNNSPEEH
jgi:hypothetical protein